MLILSLQLIIAHLIGDFLFQPNKWVRHKKKKKHQSKYLYYHILVHLAALLILLKFDFSYYLGIIIILLSHYVIDLIKLNVWKKANEQFLFFADQIAHLLVIFGVVAIYEPIQFSITSIYSLPSLLIIAFILITTIVSSVIIKTILSKWQIEEDNPNQAGKYIGIIERLFIFFFVVIDYWPGVGFLLAAKSIFRFGDLTKSKDRNLTEYILIGTLLSFGLAILSAMAYNYLLTSISMEISVIN